MKYAVHVAPGPRGYAVVENDEIIAQGLTQRAAWEATWTDGRPPEKAKGGHKFPALDYIPDRDQSDLYRNSLERTRAMFRSMRHEGR